MKFFVNETKIEEIKSWLSLNLEGDYQFTIITYYDIFLFTLDIINKESESYFLLRFPDWYIYRGNLNLAHCTGLTALPEGLAISGYLNLWGCTGLTALPEGLSASGYLSLVGCTGLKALPEGLSVGRDLYLSGCTGLTALPRDLSVGGNLYHP